MSAFDDLFRPSKAPKSPKASRFDDILATFSSLKSSNASKQPPKPPPPPQTKKQPPVKTTTTANSSAVSHELKEPKQPTGSAVALSSNLNLICQQSDNDILVCDTETNESHLEPLPPSTTKPVEIDKGNLLMIESTASALSTSSPSNSSPGRNRTRLANEGQSRYASSDGVDSGYVHSSNEEIWGASAAVSTNQALSGEFAGFACDDFGKLDTGDLMIPGMPTEDKMPQLNYSSQSPSLSFEREHSPVAVVDDGNPDEKSQTTDNCSTRPRLERRLSQNPFSGEDDDLDPSAFNAFRPLPSDSFSHMDIDSSLYDDDETTGEAQAIAFDTEPNNSDFAAKFADLGMASQQLVEDLDPFVASFSQQIDSDGISFVSNDQFDDTKANSEMEALSIEDKVDVLIGSSQRNEGRVFLPVNKLSESSIARARPRSPLPFVVDDSAILPPPKIEKPCGSPKRFNPFQTGQSTDSDLTMSVAAKSDGSTENIVEGVASDDQIGETPVFENTEAPEFFPEEQNEPGEFRFDSELTAELEPFYDKCENPVWTFGLRIPVGKSSRLGMHLGLSRSWRTVCLRLQSTNDNRFFVQLFDNEQSNKPFHVIELQAKFSISNVYRQDFDEFGKLYVVKLVSVSYKERPWLRPDKIVPRGLSYTSIKDLTKLVSKPKLTMIIDHTPHEVELIKLGSLKRSEIYSFMYQIQNCLMQISTSRVIDSSKLYAKDEIICKACDQYEAELDAAGRILWQKARIRVFFLAFLAGNVTCELGLNDKRRQGKEVVGRHDIVPVKTEEWIPVENIELHSCVDRNTFEQSHALLFQPPDAIRFELCRFRTRPPVNLELPLQITAKMFINNRSIEIRIDVIVTSYFSASRRARQAPCEDVQIRFPIPSDWIYLFRFERFGYRSIKSVTKKPGKIKGIDRIAQLAQGFASMNPTTAATDIGVDVGQAKYENITQSVTWRVDRLPQDRAHGGAYSTHLCTVSFQLDEHVPMPESFDKYVFVEYTMPNTFVSHTAVRSISVKGGNDDPPDKWVTYESSFEYKVAIEYIYGKPEDTEYNYNDISRAVTTTTPEQEQAEYAPDSSDSSSSADEEDVQLEVNIKAKPESIECTTAENTEQQLIDF